MEKALAVFTRRQLTNIHLTLTSVMHHRIVTHFIVAFLLASALVRAEKADFPGEAEEKSTHIVNGTVTAVYTKQVTSAKHETAYHIAEVRVDAVEKGDGIKPGQVIYVRYWRHVKYLAGDQPPPGPSGHANQPREGDKRRICLVRAADGALDVYYVSGFKNIAEKQP
jgi:hypothetical protein